MITVQSLHNIIRLPSKKGNSQELENDIQEQEGDIKKKNFLKTVDMF